MCFTITILDIETQLPVPKHAPGAFRTAAKLSFIFNFSFFKWGLILMIFITLPFKMVKQVHNALLPKSKSDYFEIIHFNFLIC